MRTEKDAIEYLTRIGKFVDAQSFSDYKKKFLKAHPFMIPDKILKEWEDTQPQKPQRSKR